MSFQHFRLGELAMTQPLPPHLMQHKGTTNNINGAPPDSASHFTSQPATFPSNQSTNGPTALSPGPSSTTPTKQPYGSGDADDGYTLVFPNIDAFHAWRVQEEETQMVEFVKGDTHGSKAIPPRFREHTKLVCARHSRSGRKKYVKKHPDRVRKVPSRKLEGQGCPASISYKTYFDSDVVRACYMSQHSHEVGLANLPFTRRGRKAATTEEKERSRKHFRPQDDASNTLSPTPAPDPQNAPAPLPPPPVQNHAPVHNHNAIAGPSNIQQPAATYPAAVSALAPLPSQPSYQPQQATYQQPAHQPYPQHTHVDSNATRQDRWDNMSTLFNSVREHARNFAYPAVSVAALETILIRLYLESPVGSIASPHQQVPGLHGRPQASNGVLETPP
ncbi:hypothetical protein BDN71DRAFT_40397 [Pleurotus eryngii]|uniref:Uncharacterized protein n=1 Tax=Pleurotus eryngii TaxID=5323 RepID=A0A9P6ABP6_PLEER|nr:hypothetical protein BDN71DRAFT_40397 [Pleurotus eryngii]